jgi:hypothetical protein
MWPKAGCRSQLIRRVRFFRMRRGLASVDVQVVRERVLRIEFDHRLEGFQDLQRFRLRFAVDRPQVPGAEIHERLGVERANVGILWELLPCCLHRLGVNFFERTSFLGWGSVYRAARASTSARFASDSCFDFARADSSAFQAAFAFSGGKNG